MTEQTEYISPALCETVDFLLYLYRSEIEDGSLPVDDFQDFMTPNTKKLQTINNNIKEIYKQQGVDFGEDLYNSYDPNNNMPQNEL